MAKTALDLTHQEWQAYHPGETSGGVVRSESSTAEKRRRQQALQVAHQAAQALRQQFGATRVVVFGSLARNARFTPWSDIDLAAWGIPPDQFYAAVATVTGLSDVFKVDLADPQSCSPSLRDALNREGIAL